MDFQQKHMMWKKSVPQIYKSPRALGLNDVTPVRGEGRGTK